MIFLNKYIVQFLKIFLGYFFRFFQNISQFQNLIYKEKIMSVSVVKLAF